MTYGSPRALQFRECQPADTRPAGETERPGRRGHRRSGRQVRSWVFGCSSVVRIRLFFSCRIRLFFSCGAIAATRSGDGQAGEPPGEFRRARWTGGLSSRCSRRRDVRRATIGDAPVGPAGAAGHEAGAMDRAPGGVATLCVEIHRDCSLVRRSRVPEPGADTVGRGAGRSPPTSAGKSPTQNDVRDVGTSPRVSRGGEEGREATTGNSEAAPGGGTAPLRGRTTDRGRREGDRSAGRCIRLSVGLRRRGSATAAAAGPLAVRDAEPKRGEVEHDQRSQ